MNLTTKRLSLRPSVPDDAVRAYQIQSDWAVARMLSAATFPADLALITRWFDDHQRQWSDGEAYRFVIALENRMIGLVDVDGLSDGKGTLGYWLEQAAWGQGYALEAASAVIDFAFSNLGLTELRAGHAEDNTVSGHVLLRLGFEPLDSVERYSVPRGHNIMQRRYLLRSPHTAT